MPPHLLLLSPPHLLHRSLRRAAGRSSRLPTCFWACCAATLLLLRRRRRPPPLTRAQVPHGGLQAVRVSGCCSCRCRSSRSGGRYVTPTNMKMVLVLDDSDVKPDDM